MPSDRALVIGASGGIGAALASELEALAEEEKARVQSELFCAPMLLERA